MRPSFEGVNWSYFDGCGLAVYNSATRSAAAEEGAYKWRRTVELQQEFDPRVRIARRYSARRG